MACWILEQIYALERRVCQLLIHKALLSLFLACKNVRLGGDDMTLICKKEVFHGERVRHVEQKALLEDEMMKNMLYLFCLLGVAFYIAFDYALFMTKFLYTQQMHHCKKKKKKE